jgi:CHASE domain
MVTDRNETWPFVTIPHFELQGSMVNHLAFSEMLTFIPLVRQEVRAEWEAYAATHQDWINESLVWGKVQGDIAKDMATRGLETPLTDAIWRYENGKMSKKIPVEDSNNMYGLYAPVWQQSPVPIGGAPMINFDILSDPFFQRIYHGVWEGSTPVFTGVTTVNVLANGIEADQSGNPKSYLVTPVRAGIDAVKERQAIAGLLVTFIRWKTVITQAVAQHELQGLRLVLSDSCGESYTFSTNGTEAAFKGVGDLHDGRYSNLRVNASFTPFEQSVGNEVFYDVCHYDLFVYPTLTLESTHSTSTPAVYAVVIVMAFALVALTVLFYDYTVQRRQNHVMAATKRTNAIVTSLFPANVRDRILKDMENQVENDFDYYKNLDANNPHQSASNARPIADLYPDATILFADIVGFTGSVHESVPVFRYDELRSHDVFPTAAWSSVREPAQVFTLLESLFAAFDEIAETRGVFKVSLTRARRNRGSWLAARGLTLLFRDCQTG